LCYAVNERRDFLWGVVVCEVVNMTFFSGAGPGDAVWEKGFREVAEGASGDGGGAVECAEERIIRAFKEEYN
jgi:hypothetical protein